MNERLKQIFDYLVANRLVHNQTDFASIIEKSKTTTSQILSGKTGVTTKTAEVLCSKFPEISRMWLLTGEGTMLKQELKQDNSAKVSLENIGNVEIGSLNQNAAPTAQATGGADARIAALEAENARLKEEVSWLRSLINKQ